MFIDTTIPSPAALAALLRDPSRDPAGFEFNYFDCNRCAMGLANRTWGSIRFDDASQAAKETAKLIGISEEAANRIFTLRTVFQDGASREAIAADLEALAV